MPLSTIDDVPHLILQINNSLLILSQFQSSSRLPFGIGARILLNLIILRVLGTGSLLGLVVQALRLQTNEVEEVEFQGSVGAAAKHVRGVVIHADMLHEAVGVLELLDCQDLKLISIYLIYPYLYLFNHLTIYDIQCRNLKALIEVTVHVRIHLIWRDAAEGSEFLTALETRSLTLGTRS